MSCISSSFGTSSPQRREVPLPCAKWNGNTEEGEIEWFYEDLQDLLELTNQKDVLFIIADWNAKVGSQETPAVTGKFGLGQSTGVSALASLLPKKSQG